MQPFTSRPRVTYRAYSTLFPSYNKLYAYVRLRYLKGANIGLTTTAAYKLIELDYDPPVLVLGASALN